EIHTSARTRGRLVRHEVLRLSRRALRVESLSNLEPGEARFVRGAAPSLIARRNADPRIFSASNPARIQLCNSAVLEHDVSLKLRVDDRELPQDRVPELDLTDRATNELQTIESVLATISDQDTPGAVPAEFEG